MIVVIDIINEEGNILAKDTTPVYVTEYTDEQQPDALQHYERSRHCVETGCYLGTTLYRVHSGKSYGLIMPSVPVFPPVNERNIMPENKKPK